MPKDSFIDECGRVWTPIKTIHPDDVPTCVNCGGQIEHPTKLFSEVPDNGLCECSDQNISVSVAIREVMEREIEKAQPRTVNSEPDIKIMAKGQIQGMRILAKAIVVELQREEA